MFAYLRAGAPSSSPLLQETSPRLHWSPDGLSCCSFGSLCFYGSGNNNAEPPLGTAGSNTRPFNTHHPIGRVDLQQVSLIGCIFKWRVAGLTVSLQCWEVTHQLRFEKEGGKAEWLRRSLNYCKKKKKIMIIKKEKKNNVATNWGKALNRLMCFVLSLNAVTFSWSLDVQAMYFVFNLFDPTTRSHNF